MCLNWFFNALRLQLRMTKYACTCLFLSEPSTNNEKSINKWKEAMMMETDHSEGEPEEPEVVWFTRYGCLVILWLLTFPIKNAGFDCRLPSTPPQRGSALPNADRQERWVIRLHHSQVQTPNYRSQSPDLISRVFFPAKVFVFFHLPSWPNRCRCHLARHESITV